MSALRPRNQQLQVAPTAYRIGYFAWHSFTPWQIKGRGRGEESTANEDKHGPSAAPPLGASRASVRTRPSPPLHTRPLIPSTRRPSASFSQSCAAPTDPSLAPRIGWWVTTTVPPCAPKGCAFFNQLITEADATMSTSLAHHRSGRLSVSALRPRHGPLQLTRLRLGLSS